MKKFIVFVLIFAMITVTGCGGKDGQNSSDEKVVNVFAFNGYFQDKFIEKFESDTGIKMNVTYFASNEEMLAKLQAGGDSMYDVVICGDYIIQAMIESGQNLIQPMDMSKMPNSSNCMEEYMGLYFDPQNEYSLPFMAGSNSIVVNTEMLEGVEIKSWADLWKPELAGDLMLLDDERTIIGVALAKLGYSMNETDSGKLQEAAVELEALKANVKFFNSSDPYNKLISKECAAAITWNSEGIRANQEDPAIVSVTPEEGLILWCDNFVIPSKAPHQENAYEFINWTLDGENHAIISETLRYCVPNNDALQYIDENQTQNEVIYPSAETLSKSEYIYDVGETLAEYDDIWSKFKQ